MIPAGYLAKRNLNCPSTLNLPGIQDVYSVSGDVNENFADYIKYWKHNGFWLFDSPQIIRDLALEQSINLDGTALFYYEIYEQQFDGSAWMPVKPEDSIPVAVLQPQQKKLEGYDVVTFWARNAPECSPLSCNLLAEELPTNSHCLFEQFEVAERYLSQGRFNKSEPGPYRIFAVYSVDWPESPDS